MFWSNKSFLMQPLSYALYLPHMQNKLVFVLMKVQESHLEYMKHSFHWQTNLIHHKQIYEYL
jgi:hypothetical protein